MEIRDIIKNDADRLFIVDPECYIIFTGDSVHDQQPFIRIGNWQDIPVELIPLVENIIITDGIPGNPCHEQFNIDVRNLDRNRYIGSENIVRRFLDYQKIFGLDLTNAVTVNIEKDIPELSQGKNISGKNHFIGVFYRDGNFKTVHNDNTVMDLKDVEGRTLSATVIQSRLGDSFQKGGSFGGSGLILLQHNPLFYHRGNITSYLFPSRYLEDFGRLGISPRQIKNIIFPSGNFLNLGRFFKWKHAARGALTVFSDHAEQFQLIKNLFRNCTIDLQPYRDMRLDSGDGLSVTGYQDSFNIRLTFGPTAGGTEPLTIAFVKGASGIGKVLRDKLDALFIEYSAYEETNLLFKSTTIPFAVINDRNRNIAPILGEGITLLHPGVPYELKKIPSLEALLQTYSPVPGIMTLLEQGQSPEEMNIPAMLGASGADGNDEAQYQMKRYNLRSILKALLDSTGNRKLYQNILALLRHRDLEPSSRALFSGAVCTRADLVLFNRYLYTFITEARPVTAPLYMDEIRDTDDSPGNPAADQSASIERIKADRIRLMRLLECFREARTDRNELFIGEVEKLSRAIEDRKLLYTDDMYEEPTLQGADTAHMTAASMSEEVHEVLPPGSDLLKKLSPALVNIGSRSRDVIGKAAVATAFLREKAGKYPARTAGIGFVTLLLLVLAIFLLTSGDERTASRHGKNGIPGSKSGLTSAPSDHSGPVTKSDEILSPDQVKEYENMPEKFRSNITDTDIYRYANRVAVKNGYSEISVENVQGKNPHWIFPSNVFLLLDDERVVVVRGDTLWDIARRKLMETDILFYQEIKALEKARGSEREDLLRRARDHAFSERHRIILQELTKRND